MDVHRAAGLVRHRLGHESRIDLVPEGGLAHRALVEVHMIGAAHGIAVDEVDLHLGTACLVGESINVEFLRLAVFVHFLKERVELVEGINAVKLPGHFLAPGASHRRGQRVVGVLVDLGEVELQFRSHHGAQPVFFVKFEDAA